MACSCKAKKNLTSNVRTVVKRTSPSTNGRMSSSGRRVVRREIK